MARDPKWIEHAHLKKGAESKAAHKAGMSTGAYAKKHEHDSGKAGHRARLAMVLRKLREKK